jgi:hypothetical protein
LADAVQLAFPFATVEGAITEYNLKERLQPQRDIMVYHAVSEVSGEYFS